MGIKGTSADGPITESPQFGSVQWRQSISHMPRAAPQPAPEPEPMDIPEMAAEPEIAVEAEEQPEEQTEEYEEGILITRSDLYYFQENLVDLQSQIADLQRDVLQDRLEV
jgi:hypothetical protein